MECRRVFRGAIAKPTRKNYLIVANGYNGFHKPSLAELVVSYSQEPRENLKATEPIFTAYDANQLDILNEADEKELVTVCGNLCTAADLLGKNLELPKAEIGDIVTVSNAGSYGFTLSPILFSSHEIPYEIYLDSEKNVIINKY